MKLYLLFLGLLFSTLLFAQDYKLCGTDEMAQKALETEPELLNNIKLLKHQADSIIANNLFRKTENEIHVIPVVVHVMHDGDNSNISDAQIHDAIRIINEDYNKMNSDTSEVINEFKNISANTGIEFKLAKLDPDGNCTQGITRTYTELTNDAGENVKELVKWDPRMYLNIWVVTKLTIEAGGYSYLPGSAPNNDANAGIVVLASQFGSIGASNGNNLSSRTLTHEVGHYLGLHHTWGSSNENYLEENCDTDDYIEDTPNTIGSATGNCNLTQSSCGNLDNVQNYMDYSSCAKMYTNGQKTIMRTILETGYIWSNAARNNLPTDENLMLTGVHEDYVAPDCLATIDFKNESSVSCPMQEVEWINLSWNYSTAISYEWTFTGGTPSTSTEENPVITYNQAGIYDVSLAITTSGGTNSKTIENAIYIQDQSELLTAPNTINFDSNEFPSNSNQYANWYVEEYFEGETWHWNTLGSTTSDGSIRIRSWDFIEQGTRKAYTPVFDLSNVPAPCYMYYDYAYARKNHESADELKVKISSNCGQTWSNRLAKSTDNLVTVSTNYFFDFNPTDALWEEQRISLNPWVGDSHVQAVFEFAGSNGNYLYIDNIRFGVPSLSTEELTASNIHLEVFPNPNDGNAIIQFNLLNPHKVELNLTNVLGKQICSMNENYKSGQHQIDLKTLMPDLKPGLYFLNCTIGNYRETKQIVVY
ncbi:MAG: M43 family zinc metalloprotease [Flavobacteriales bacterium]|nr:M43 family zinc metalloprotease [Flavobacteriales bacterium]